MKFEKIRIEEAKRAIKRPLSTERHYDEDRKRSATERSRGGGSSAFEAPPPPRFETSISLASRFVENFLDFPTNFLNIEFISRSSQYDRVGATESKKRIDDYASKRDDYSSSKSRDDYKRDTYKRSDDYKRDLDIPPRHTSEYF